MGVSIMSEKAAERFVQEKRLLKFDLPNAEPRDLYLVWRRGAVLSGGVQEFMTFLLETQGGKNP